MQRLNKTIAKVLTASSVGYFGLFSACAKTATATKVAGPNQYDRSANPCGATTGSSSLALTTAPAFAYSSQISGTGADMQQVIAILQNVPDSLYSPFFYFGGSIQVVSDVGASCNQALTAGEKVFYQVGATNANNGACWTVQNGTTVIMINRSQVQTALLRSIMYSLTQVYAETAIAVEPAASGSAATATAATATAATGTSAALALTTATTAAMVPGSSYRAAMNTMIAAYLADHKALAKTTSGLALTSFAQSEPLEFARFALAESTDSYFCNATTRSAFKTKAPRSYAAYQAIVGGVAAPTATTGTTASASATSTGKATLALDGTATTATTSTSAANPQTILSIVAALPQLLAQLKSLFPAAKAEGGSSGGSSEGGSSSSKGGSGGGKSGGGSGGGEGASAGGGGGKSSGGGGGKSSGGGASSGGQQTAGTGQSSLPSLRSQQAPKSGGAGSSPTNTSPGNVGGGKGTTSPGATPPGSGTGTSGASGVSGGLAGASGGGAGTSNSPSSAGSSGGVGSGSDPQNVGAGSSGSDQLGQAAEATGSESVQSAGAASGDPFASTAASEVSGGIDQSVEQDAAAAATGGLATAAENDIGDDVASDIGGDILSDVALVDTKAAPNVKKDAFASYFNRAPTK